MNTEMLKIGGDSIAIYQSQGKGPAALLVHGNSCSSRSYQRQLEGAFGEKFRLVAMDLPGHGQSSPASDPATYSLPGYAEVVVEVAKQLGLAEAVFVGWSLGGHIVLEASGQLPKAAGWMIFGAPPLAFPPAMAEAFLPNPAVAVGFKPDLTDEEAAAYAASFFKPGTPTPDSFLEDIRRTDGRARLGLGGSIRPDGYKDEVEIVANLSVPLAILHGEHEQLVNRAYISALKMPGLWRGAVQIVGDAGHAPHWEQPDQFNSLLEAFLLETAKR
ncbi:MAG: alpha/beta hydrolase [Chloroflexi bacterium]|nr:alpha/beta hydrolase [Chloroflexota bacterium]